MSLRYYFFFNMKTEVHPAFLKRMILRIDFIQDSSNARPSSIDSQDIIGPLI